MSESDPAFAAMRRYVLSEAMRPGDEVTEAGLTRLLSISRLGTRTAMVRLSTEGLLELRPFRGARIPVLDEREIAEIFETALPLESMLAGLAAERRSAADLGRLRRLQTDLQASVERGDAGHVMTTLMEADSEIARIARHDTCRRTCRGLHDRIIHPWRAALQLGHTARQLATAYGEVLAEVRAGDAPASREAAVAFNRTTAFFVRHALVGHRHGAGSFS